MLLIGDSQFRPEGTGRLNVKGWKIIYCVNGSGRKAGVAILMSDKIDFKAKAMIRNKEGYIMILHNDKRDGPTGGYNNYKYLCTQHGST